MSFRAVVLVFACLLAAGCATTPRPSQPGTAIPADLNDLDRWQARGRLGVSGPANGGSGSFEWHQVGDRADVEIRGPVGIGGVHLQMQGDGANPDLTLQTSDGQTLQSDAAWNELQTRLGAAVPAGNLRFWMLGLAAPGEHQWHEANAEGVVALEQGGWRIEYQKYSDEFGARVPMRMTATSGDARVRIVVDRWQIRPMSIADELLGLPEPWPAPAKLNLCLHIVGRRDDGYHLLQSAMQIIDLCDELQFYRRPPGVIERIGGPDEIPADTDLIVRAARLLASHYEVHEGVGIAIHKRIPIQGGLGGGSSDAATVLVALNHLWELDIHVDELAAQGLKLGADVPVFVRGHSAWAEGVGERLTPSDFPERVYLVLKPAAGVSTAAVFQDPELTRNSPVTTIRAFLAGGGRNDCAPVVRKRSGEIAEALDWLSEFGEARLTGTGACVFVAMADEAAAQRAAARVPARWTGYVVRGVNRSPLLDRLAHEAG